MGKIYTNTMMVILNNRLVLQAQDESIFLDEDVLSSTSMSDPGISHRPAFSTLNSRISVMHEQWTIPPDVYEIQLHVSICYPSFSFALVLIFLIFIRVPKN